LVNSQLFRQRLLQSIGLSAKDDRATRVISDSLRALPDTSDTIAVGVSALEGQQARDAIDAVVPVLNEEQDRAQQPVIDDINAQIAETKENITDISQIQQEIRELAKASSSATTSSDAKGATEAQLLDTLSRNEQALMNLRASLRDLTSRANPDRTYKATIVGDIVVSAAPLSPRSSRVAIFAGVLTLVGFLLYGLVRQPKSP
jgi:DNA repair exonuclease SbcCD ATPase subunit